MNIIKRILQDKISERIEPNKAVLLFWCTTRWKDGSHT